MSRKDELKQLKNMYKKIEVPKNIDDVIKSSISMGKKELKRQTKKAWFKKGLCAVVAVFAVFIITVNTIPSFVNAAANVPVIGNLVKIVSFNKEGMGSGGMITDGSNVNSISCDKENKKEHIIINFSKENETQDVAPSYDIKYSRYPYILSFEISGVRSMDALDNLETLKDSKCIKDVYRLITLDDSMVRFNIEFNQPVKYKVAEYKEPAQIVVTFTEDKEARKKIVYSVRSASYEMDESIAVLEEKFLDESNLRILKDEEGTFFIEVGCFETKEDAEEKLSKIKSSNFYIESRGSTDIPKAIK